jgi:hypothetical protein
VLREELANRKDLTVTSDLMNDWTSPNRHLSFDADANWVLNGVAWRCRQKFVSVRGHSPD